MQGNGELPPKTWWLCKEHINGFHKERPTAILRPCPFDHDEVVALLKKKVIPLYGARYSANEDESPEQFEIRLAADGIGVDFVLEDEYDDFVSHTCIKSSLTDCHTGKILYSYNGK